MAKRYGLILTLGNAPLTPHFVEGIPGFYRADIATPVGGDGEMDLDDARAAAKRHDLELVEIPAGQVAEAEELVKRTLDEARKGVVALRGSDPQGAEHSRIKAAAKAAGGN